MINMKKSDKKLFSRAPLNIETRPVKLFADRDRDGVANVFDCQPRNPRRQDKKRNSYGTSYEDTSMALDDPSTLSEEGLKKRRQWKRRKLIEE